MQFSNLALIFALASSVIAAPGMVEKRALTFKLYNDFQVSDGKAGEALELVNKAFPIGSDPKKVSKEDIAILKAARKTSEDAEQEFLKELAAAGGKFPDGSPLSVGMTMNKVLKLRTFEMFLEAELAQGLKDKADPSGQAQLDDVQKKLAANVKGDKANAGKPSKGVKFDGPPKP